MQQDPPMRDVVLVGGGHAHIQAIKMLRMKKPGDVRITVVSDSTTAFYSGMLPGCVAGQYTPDEIEFDLDPLCTWAGARLIRDAVTGMDPDNHEIHFRDRPPLGYDLCSINTGSTIRGADVPGVREHAIPTRPLVRFMDSVVGLDARILEKPDLHVVVVGGGPAGFELAMTLLARLSRSGSPQVTLLDASDQILAGGSPALRRRGARVLEELGIPVVHGFRADRVEPGRVVARDGREQDFDALVWATGGAAHAFQSNCGLDLDERGFFKVDEFLRTSHPDVFAVGDCASFPKPLAKAGVYSVRQGPVLIGNLLARLDNGSIRPYEPQHDFLRLLNAGDGRALADWNGMSFFSGFAWHWKDWIDRRFMDRFRPELIDPDFFEQLDREPMRCAGCGSKVAAGVLEETLAGFRGTHGEVFTGEADDAAVIERSDGIDVTSVDQLRSFIADPWVFGRVCVIHSLSDIYAMGATPVHALAAVTVAPGSERVQARDLKQLMGGIAHELRAARTELVGGHTSESAEATIALTVTGRTDRPLRKGGARPGDRLLLTKPLGVGILMAAAMRGRARGRWVDEAVRWMLTSSAEMSRVFVDNGARALTDVTGFGLAGHLREVGEASGTGFALDQDLPLLPGTDECLERGIESTLTDSNRAAMGAWIVDPGLSPAIHDPQTSGGLVAAVPVDRVGDVLAECAKRGLACQEIGEATDRAGRLDLRN